jgi:hypothetical protein
VASLFATQIRVWVQHTKGPQATQEARQDEPAFSAKMSSLAARERHLPHS